MLPILVFAGSLICLANLLGLALFALAYRRQSARQRELLHQTRDDFQEAINQILDRYQALRERVEEEEVEENEFETIATTLPAIRPLGNGITFSKRAQILRLHRQGESPAQIAENLGVGKAETELVIKLHAATATVRG